jgi:hypothetical protein
MEPWQILVAALSGVAYLSLLAVPIRTFVLAERAATARAAHLRESLEVIRRALTEAGASRESRLFRVLDRLEAGQVERAVNYADRIVKTIDRSSDDLREYWNAVRHNDRENAQRFVNDMQAAAFAQWPTPRDLQVIYERRGVAQEREQGIADGAAERRRREAERRRAAKREAE